MFQQKSVFTAQVTILLLSCLWSLQTLAWTDNITETAYVNKVCELVPEAQCSWAILID